MNFYRSPYRRSRRSPYRRSGRTFGGSPYSSSLRRTLLERKLRNKFVGGGAIYNAREKNWKSFRIHGISSMYSSLEANLLNIIGLTYSGSGSPPMTNWWSSRSSNPNFNFGNFNDSIEHYRSNKNKLREIKHQLYDIIELREQENNNKAIERREQRRSEIQRLGSIDPTKEAIRQRQKNGHIIFYLALKKANEALLLDMTASNMIKFKAVSKLFGSLMGAYARLNGTPLDNSDIEEYYKDLNHEELEEFKRESEKD